MSALPTGLILVPEVTELGMSVAMVALADTSAERRAGLLDMWRTIEVLRRVRDSIRSEYSGTTGPISHKPPPAI